MPPFRQPTPSPPPPPVPSAVPAGAMAASASNEGGPRSESGVEIPPNFVPPPPPREVAAGVANLGNTCYMNAALQALAHAPELCHALDAEGHLARCPVAMRNERRRRVRARERANAKANDASGQQQEGQGEESSGDEAAKGKKSHRRSNSSSSAGSSSSRGSKGKRKDMKSGQQGNGSMDYDPDYEFCTLCEVERLLGRVHSRPVEAVVDEPQDRAAAGDNGSSTSTPASVPPASSQEGPVVPEAFVSGFMSKVAPWFRRGVQEDSHEFLRLLIDAMQNSCKGARKGNGGKAASKKSNAEDEEYPFRLFRGTVESNVKCSACRATSCKIDPIEDIGLDILPLRTNATAPPRDPYASSTRGGTLSRSSSPTSNMALADVPQALERFISSEHLDSGYKCEQCGKLGKATKTSKLASIPPILTLHLKRFRYGSAAKRGSSNNGGYDTGGGGTSRSRSARGAPQPDFDNVGPSGSAKIEGHVPFQTVLDIRPYLTPALQQGDFKRALCRLFAVVCHTGKNSHSGHYVAYVHNVTKRNQWWKMDDAKVTPVTQAEVMNAEAYMLFYRVTSHPVAARLKGIADAKEEAARRVVDEIKRREAAARAAEEAQIAHARRAAAALQDFVEKGAAADVLKTPPNPEGDPPSPRAVDAVPLGKRARPPLASGDEWHAAATDLPPDYLPLLGRIQEFVADNVQFSPEFFGYITAEYNRMSEGLSVGRRLKNNKRIKTLLGKGPRGVYPPEDVRGGVDDLHGGILDLFHQISCMHKQCGGGESFLLPEIKELKEAKEEEQATAKEASAPKPEVVPPEPAPELLIPQDNGESYDGAL